MTVAKKRQTFPVRASPSAEERWGRHAPPESDKDPVAVVYRGEYLAAHEILEEHGGVNVPGVLEVAANAAAWLTGDVARLPDKVGAPPVACGEGCAWCCSIAVAAWPMELLVLAAWLESKRTPAELEDLKARLRAHVVEADRQAKAAPGRPRRVPCALLDGARCSVYHVRPSACVGWNAEDAGPCKAYAEGDDAAQCAVNPLRLTTPRVVPEAAAAAVAHRGGPAFDDATQGPGSGVDLAAGLLAVLEVGAGRAAAEWLAGSAFLDGARARVLTAPADMVAAVQKAAGRAFK